ncbi:MAG: inositol monophosphatase [Muribaculaceae bacterium]|nr:inositol monophosphatase [Muribaculaceae bacterium]
MKLTEFIPDIPQEYQVFLTGALTLAEKAGDIQMKYFRKGNLEQSTKLNDSDVVTIADKESEICILDFIHSHFPEHGIISEESGIDHEDREWRWVVDPLDGTTNFSNGLTSFCVSIALQHNKESVIGVVYAPYLRECFYAVKGAGAWLNGKPIHCSEKSEISKAVVATGMPYDRNENPDNNLAELSRMAFRIRGMRFLGSAAMDLSYTAAGYLDAYWELNLKLWDIAAGQLIAMEAGAKVESIRTDRSYSLLASNPNLHTSLLKIIQEGLR